MNACRLVDKQATWHRVVHGFVCCELFWIVAAIDWIEFKSQYDRCIEMFINRRISISILILSPEYRTQMQKH